MKNYCFNLLKRLYSTSKNVEAKVCIIGSGPAGFYAAHHLMKHHPSIKIDIYEKLPVPFGLVRFGVAPDHPEVKNVLNTFTKTAENDKVRFYGNVCLGRDIKLNELKAAYHVVVLAYGAEKNRKLHIPGENLKNVFSAKNVVGWYNGVPEQRDLNIDLSNPTAVIIGNGNVAVDVARILLMPIDELKSTDIAQHALEALSRSNVKEISLIGRRGPIQAAYTIKELREMLKLRGCSTVWNPVEFSCVEEALPQLQRPRKRLTELMFKSISAKATESKLFKPLFFRSPLAFVGTEKVENLVVVRNKLDPNSSYLTPKVLRTEQTEHIDCGLAIISVGYKSVQVDPDIPFDDKRGVVINTDGKMSGGFYSTGWLATGPKGVILTTMSNSFCVADHIANELKKTQIKEKPGFSDVRKLLEQRGVQVVYWKDWLKIDAYEREAGKKVGKPREKIVCIDKMLEIAA